MIYSRTSEYAIRALIYLARCAPGRFVTIKEIARAEQISSGFLAKILQALAKQDLVRSSKGPGGGFMLSVDSGGIRLWDIVSALEGTPSYDQCAMGRPACSGTHPCSLHNGWHDLRSHIVQYLQGTSIAGLAGTDERNRSSC